MRPTNDPQLFIPLGDDSVQTTTSTSYTPLNGGTFLVNPGELHGGEYVTAQLWVRAASDSGETVTFAISEAGAGGVQTESEVSISGGFANAYGPEIRLLEDPGRGQSHFAVKWKVSGGTGEAGKNSSLGVLLRW